MSDFTVEVERETDGRWIGEVTDLSGVLAYGSTRDEAVAKAKALAFRVLADRIEHADLAPAVSEIAFPTVPPGYFQLVPRNTPPALLTKGSRYSFVVNGYVSTRVEFTA